MIKCTDSSQFALVTGASSGIGLAISRELAQRGYPVLLADIDKEKLEQAATEISGEFNVPTLRYHIDLARQDSAQELFDYCAANNITVSILVNNAGMYFFSSIADTPAASIEAMINLHMHTPTMLCRLFCEQMLRENRKGYIMNISSITAWMRVPGLAMYGATKDYLRAFSFTMNLETKKKGVSVTTICPGPVATNLYSISPKFIKIGLRSGIVLTPEKLAKKALKKTFKRKAQYIPGLINKLLIAVVTIAPKSLVKLIKKGM